MAVWLAVLTVGWGYWPTNHTIGCGPPYSTTLGPQEFIVSDHFMSGLEVINRYGFMHPPDFPVTEPVVEVMRVVSPQRRGQWAWGDGGFETEIVWFFHAPGSGVWLNLSGRPRVNTFKGKPDTLSRIREITANGTVVFRAGAGFTEIMMRSDTWTGVATACPDVPFVCNCTQSGWASACDGATLVERHGLVCSDPVPEPTSTCHSWALLVVAAVVAAGGCCASSRGWCRTPHARCAGNRARGAGADPLLAAHERVCPSQRGKHTVATATSTSTSFSQVSSPVVSVCGD